jgi:Tol biopolymer transport system component
MQPLPYLIECTNVLVSALKVSTTTTTIFLVGLVLALSACEADEQRVTRSVAPSTSPQASSVSPSETPLPVATPEPLGRVQNVTEDGFYVLEPDTGLVWRIDQSQGASGAWSPDGNFFVRFGQGHQDADVIDLATGSVRRIFSGAFWHFSWSPDGSHLAFSTGDGLFIVQRDGTDLRLAAAVDGRAGMGWSPRGDLIASAERYVVRITEVSTGETRGVSPEVGADDLLGFIGWLADGSRLLFCSSQATDAKDSRLSPGSYVYDDTNESTRKVADQCGVVVSPDGQSFASSDENGVYLVHANGAEPPRLLAEGYDLGEWSTDGASMTLGHNACVTRDYDIYSVRIDSGVVARLTESSNVYKESAGWSPAANELAYSALLEDRQALFLLDMDTGELKELLTSAREFHIHGPSWSPDGRYISFSGGGGHGGC